MSCNGCRVLRKGCSERCALRSCLQWIESPEAQGHATLFLAKFFGRSDLMSFISSVLDTRRPALFQSLLFEACGRTVNPVNGALGLLCSGNWHLCQAALETVLAGGVLRPLPEIFGGVLMPILDESSDSIYKNACNNTGKSSVYSEFQPFMHDLLEMNQKSDSDLSVVPKSCKNINAGRVRRQRETAMSMTSYASYGGDEKKILNLFV